MKKVLFGLMAISLLAATGCKKDKDETCDLNTTTLQGTYKITAATYKADANAPVEDEYATWDLCDKDDLYILGANFQLTITDAGQVCTPSNSDTGGWLFDAANNQLSLIVPSGNVAGTVSNFSCSGMTLSVAGFDPGEVTTLTFAKQ